METIELIRIQDMLNDFSKKIQGLEKLINLQPEANSSEEIKELATALAKAQAEFSVAGENKNNPFFKSAYADLMSVVQASRPALTKNGLSVIQIILDGDDGKWLITKLMHTSGEWVHSKVKIVPAKNDVQGISSTITYMKRVCYVSLVGVVVGEEDDDGEAAVVRTQDVYPQSYGSKEEPVITKDQLEEINMLLQDRPDVAKTVLDGLKKQGIDRLADIPKAQYYAYANRIRELKQAESGK
jgi:hypothetical protein